jgi:hypothetical protein
VQRRATMGDDAGTFAVTLGRDMQRERPPRDKPPQARCRLMAQKRPRAARQDGRGRLRHRILTPRADAIDPVVHGTPDAGLHTARDQPTTDAQAQQLRPRHMPVLPTRKTQNRQLEATFTAISCIFRHYLLRACSGGLSTPPSLESPPLARLVPQPTRDPAATAPRAPGADRPPGPRAPRSHSSGEPGRQGRRPPSPPRTGGSSPGAPR